jgi:hypothetical protein
MRFLSKRPADHAELGWDLVQFQGSSSARLAVKKQHGFHVPGGNKITTAADLGVMRKLNHEAPP